MAAEQRSREETRSAIEGWCVVGALVSLLLALMLLAHVTAWDNLMNIPD